MFDSATTRSEGGTACLSAWPRAERVPRMHWIAKKDGFKASLMTRASDTVRTHLQRCRTLGEGLLKLCAHQSPYTGRTHILFPPPQAASVRPSFEPTATPPSWATSRGYYRYANPPHSCIWNSIVPPRITSWRGFRMLAAFSRIALTL